MDASVTVAAVALLHADDLCMSATSFEARLFRFRHLTDDRIASGDLNNADTIASSRRGDVARSDETCTISATYQPFVESDSSDPASAHSRASRRGRLRRRWSHFSLVDPRCLAGRR
jgi:hypothetical protein